MPFDPTKPVSGVPTDAVEMRNQLNALKALIDVQAAQIADRTNFADVNDLISQNSASNVDDLSFLTVSISNPPTQAEVQAIVTAFNNLITALQH